MSEYIIILVRGPVAQLGERTVRIRKVESSILFGSIKGKVASAAFFFYQFQKRRGANEQVPYDIVITANNIDDL